MKSYRNVYDANGKLISSTYEATSDYKVRNKVISRGPALPETPASGGAEITEPQDPAAGTTVPDTPDTPAAQEPQTPSEPQTGGDGTTIIVVTPEEPQ